MNLTAFLNPFLELLLLPLLLTLLFGFGLRINNAALAIFFRDRSRMNISCRMSSVLFIGCLVEKVLFNVPRMR